MTHWVTLLAHFGDGRGSLSPSDRRLPRGGWWMVYIWYTWYQMYQMYTVDGSARTPAVMADIRHLWSAQCRE